MGLSRKRQKELRQLQGEAAKLWAAQQVLVGDAAHVAREAGRQLDHFRREQVAPAVQDVYEHRVLPAVDRGVRYSRDVVDNRVVPAVGGVIGSALTAWDIANAKRTGSPRPVASVSPSQKSGPGIGTVIAVVLGIGAAIGVLVAAWQTLRADDELWVADDPLSAPEA
ncbi:DNA helicase [Microbacterium capsulatum]|uniref:DNA helicase n=1 Tax=Microbacterium capsulatum TaxID=3041921 RepID=A0ABU0XI18_9MICO|nr:DNA helicase [Microbacterium sp. ASV81]MDQ4214781.1 DNA helicase [Microbacterium sp. ASV81]